LSKIVVLSFRLVIAIQGKRGNHNNCWQMSLEIVSSVVLSHYSSENRHFSEEFFYMEEKGLKIFGQ
jgi:hypothetical protein